MRSERLTAILSIAAVAFCLLQVWLPSHYLTCDGPCHLYNARILHDFWTNSSQDFYTRFYHISYTTDPNVTSTYLLAALLFLFKGAVTEKVFLSIYIVLLSAGSIKLLQKLQGGPGLWQLAGLPVIFTFLLSKGFYNFSLGIALWPWMIWSWIRLMEQRKTGHILLFAAVCYATYFTHLLPFLSGAVACGCLAISHSISAGDNTKRNLLVHSAILACVFVPLLFLSILFTNGEGGLRMQLAAHPYRLQEMLELKYLINVTEAEKYWALASGIALLALTVAALLRFRIGKPHKYDGLLYSLLPVGFAYLFFPEDFMGRAIIITARVQLVLYLIAVSIIAYRLESARVKQVGAILLITCFGVLSAIRMNCRQEADTALKNHLAVGGGIRLHTIVLPLDLAENGTNKDGQMIADRNSIFHHASHYLAADKPLIMLDNYEANAGYFPVSWRPEANPYHHLSTGRGIEGVPPAGDITQYERETGRKIDYVLLAGYDTRYLTDTGFNSLIGQVYELFKETGADETGRSILCTRDYRNLE